MGFHAMPFSTFLDDVLALPVFDTHTHLNNPGVPVAAWDVWDILHYFWFQRELVAAGYPAGANELDPDHRFREAHQALRQTRNTTWNWAVRHMAQDLYGIRLDSEAALRELDAAVRTTAAAPDWPRQVIDRIGVRRIAVNAEANADLPGLPGVGCALPIKPAGGLAKRCEAILTADRFPDELERQAAEIRAEVAQLAARGICGVRVDQLPQDVLGERAYAYGAAPPSGKDDPDHLRTYLFSVLFDALDQHGLLAQLFLGLRRSGEDAAVPVPTAFNDTARIVRLHGLFHRYPNVRFELVLGCELNNMDVVQAARIYPNVNPGGLWWFNFRISSYQQAMQYRFEALPPNRCTAVASDARCIEWCYTKILLVKHVLARFFWDQIAAGWIDAPDALWVARWWLHDTAARHYTVPEPEKPENPKGR